MLNVAFTISATGLCYAFYKTWNNDPGTVSLSLEEKYKVSAFLVYHLSKTKLLFALFEYVDYQAASRIWAWI